MKKQYTKKQIQEAINYWQKQLKLGNYKKLTESYDDINCDCAKRRMKLFDAAERRGATVYKCKDWVLAALPTAKAAQPFGRYRPKVDEQGRIKEECNLETWEGITPENKEIRDSADYPCIKDGLYKGYCYETYWCTSGWQYPDKRQWDNATGPGNLFHAYYNRYGAPVVFMDCNTGYLYQYCGGMILDETDRRGGILKGFTNMIDLFSRYPSLHDAFTASGFDEYLVPNDRP